MKKPKRTHYTFVGECRSLTAIRKGWSWEDGRLAAKPLFEALDAMGIDIPRQSFVNLFTDPSIAPSAPKVRATVKPGMIAILRECSSARVIVALGKRVSAELTKSGIEHVALVHPAARGRIRLRRRYIAHVRKNLSSAVPA